MRTRILLIGLVLVPLGELRAEEGEFEASNISTAIGTADTVTRENESTYEDETFVSDDEETIFPNSVEKDGPKRDSFGAVLPDGAVCRMGSVTYRHGSSVTAVAFTRDGRFLLTGTHAGRIHEWDATTGELVQVVDGVRHDSGPMYPVDAVAVSSDELHVASVGRFGVCLWDRKNEWELVRRIPTKSPSKTAAFSPDGAFLATAGLDGILRVWNSRSGDALFGLESDKKNSCMSLAFSNSGAFLVAGHNGAVVRIWDVTEKTLVRELSLEGTSPVTQVSFVDDDRLLLTTQWDKTCVWNATDGEKVSELPVGRLLAVPSKGHLVALANLETQCVELWNAEMGQRIRRCEGEVVQAHSMAFSPNDKMLAVSVAGGQELGYVIVFDVDTGKRLACPKGHLYRVASLTFAIDGRSLISASADGTVRFWNAANGEQLRTHNASHNGLRSVRLLQDGDALAVAGKDGVIQILNSGTMQLLRTFGNPGEVTAKAVLANDAGWVGMTHLREIRIWRPRATESELLDRLDQLGSFCYDGHKYLAWSGIDRGVFFTDEYDENPWKFGSIRIHNLDNGETRTIRGKFGYAASLAFSPQGNVLASGQLDGNIYMWNVITSKNIFTKCAHEPHEDAGQRVHKGRPAAAVTALAFSKDGNFLASGGHDGRVCLWDVQTGEAIATFEGHLSQVCDLAFDPNGVSVASASADGTIVVWRIAPSNVDG